MEENINKNVNALVLQTDFGLGDGAVCAMYGVARSVSAELPIYDLTHEIEPYHIWEASLRLIQAVPYWPAGTVFVSVVDPGVGSTRRSIVAKTKGGHYIVTPDNGTLTHVKLITGLEEVRTINEVVNRRPHTERSYTFHGRDVYVFSGARLASGKITFEEVGSLVPVDSIVELPVIPPKREEGSITGTIDILDVRFGSLWTNIPWEKFQNLQIEYGERVEITIRYDGRTVYQNRIIYGHSFADVYIGEPILYVNSLDRMAVAINQGSFARAYNIGTGNSWQITLGK